MTELEELRLAYVECARQKSDLLVHRRSDAAEIKRLRNDLADALDCKAGNGPTALSRVISERDELRAEIERLRAQEPDAWRITDGEGGYDYRTDGPEQFNIDWVARYGRKYEPLFLAAPPAQPAQRLTDEHRELVEALRGGRRCDEYGIDIIMLRQACCDAADIIESAVVPPGYVVVPVEPTERMGNCGFRAGAKSSFAADMIYRAMIAATPTAGREDSNPVEFDGIRTTTTTKG